ncbi:hypothetical protein BCR43DRAFT_116624 [Syncephalastrum racemosum]|uniref:Uncharacterized protein n=1 Tax=Syncephalastrum racemosum TaxID=13706 RepID=A0A1X2GZ89_SYNRA|nr:hypothetical protein BCR43DRAFT_116624 [Syncephalastrum racemosum]
MFCLGDVVGNLCVIIILITSNSQNITLLLSAYLHDPRSGCSFDLSPSWDIKCE